MRERERERQTDRQRRMRNWREGLRKRKSSIFCVFGSYNLQIGSKSLRHLVHSFLHGLQSQASSARQHGWKNLHLGSDIRGVHQNKVNPGKINK